MNPKPPNWFDGTVGIIIVLIILGVVARCSDVPV